MFKNFANNEQIEIQFWGHTDRQTHTHTYICTTRAASSQLKSSNTFYLNLPKPTTGARLLLERPSRVNFFGTLKVSRDAKRKLGNLFDPIFSKYVSRRGK